MSIQVIIDGVIHYGGLALIHGTVLALVTWLLSATVLRRSRPAVQAVLWTIVLVKFLLPPVLPGEMALSRWVAEVATTFSAQQRANTDSHSGLTTRERSAITQPTTPVESARLPVTNLLFGCYLCLIILLSCRAWIAFRRARWRIHTLPFADHHTRSEVLTLAEKIGLHNPPLVRMTDDEMTPYVFGFGRAVLVLPERLMRLLEPEERHALILHELAHIRRGDQLIRTLQSLAGVVFFFFPPVLWVCRRVEHFTEMACDRWALAVSEVEPSTYADALIKVVKEMRHVPQVGLPLVRSVRLLEERLRDVLHDDVKKSPQLSRAVKVALVCWSLFVLAGGSKAKAFRETPANQADSAAVSFQHEPSPERAPGVMAGQKPSRNPQGVSSRQISHEQPVEQVHPDTSESHSDQPAQLAGQSLSPYEEGYRLGAQERARSQMHSEINEQTNSAAEESKHEIEMRMHQLTRHPPQK